jgi:hypothetical protein
LTPRHGPTGTQQRHVRFGIDRLDFAIHIQLVHSISLSTVLRCGAQQQPGMADKGKQRWNID